MSPVLGIDLGTTHSVIACFRDNEIQFLPNGLGEWLTPSAVALSRSGELVVGRTAKNIQTLSPSMGAARFKTQMGTDSKLQLGKQRLSPIELSALVLQSLKEDARKTLGMDVHKAVITVPAYFSEAQREATRKAGELAGWEVVRILNEPTAAAISYGLEKRTDVSRFLVFDLGGGTFDVCIMEMDDGILEVLSVAGISQMGGEDFTRAILDTILTDLGLNYEEVLKTAPEQAGILLRRAELLKRELSRIEKAEIRIPELPGFDETTVRWSRAELNATMRPFLEKLAAPCRSALRSASMKATDLDAVILVGGATRMPCIRDFVEDYFETEALSIVDPDLVVAQGAAIQGALYAEDAAVEEIVVTDVLSHSLGLEVSKEIASKIVDGFFSPIIHRNTVIPTTRSGIVRPMRPGQTEIEVHIYEGESRFCKDNRLLGKLRVKGIPKAHEKSDVEVRYSYDLDGILEVEATILATGQTVSQILTRDSRSLSEKEMQAARKRMESLKYDFRQDQRIQGLMSRAELLLREMPGSERRRLEEYLDQMEEALELREKADIEMLFNEIQKLCDRFGPEES